MRSSVRSALIVWGGWEGHEPQQVAELFACDLEEQGFLVRLINGFSALEEGAWLNELSLIVPICTMTDISKQQLRNLLEAVRGGVGIAGCHGGMCDAFRQETEYHFMTGGQFVAHPGDGGVTYRVRIVDATHEITSGLSDFDVTTEQYYMHVDPAVKVLASTAFPVAPGPHEPNGPIEMPVAWTKLYGKGRVFYCSLGHNTEVLKREPVRQLMVQGMVWASRGCE